MIDVPIKGKNPHMEITVKTTGKKSRLKKKKTLSVNAIVLGGGNIIWAKPKKQTSEKSEHRLEIVMYT